MNSLIGSIELEQHKDRAVLSAAVSPDEVKALASSATASDAATSAKRE